MTESIEQLRSAVSNESLPANRRSTAADLLIAALTDIPLPSEDDPRIQPLQTPPETKTDGMSEDMAAWYPQLICRALEIWNEICGWDKSGPTNAQARKYIRERDQQKIILGLVADESEHRLTRLAGCRAFLATVKPESLWKQYSPEKLLAAVKPATSYKVLPLGERVPVARPPVETSDVWDY